MAECYFLVSFLFLVVEAQQFPYCGKKITCKSWLETKIRVDLMFGKLEELSMTQYKQKRLEEFLFLGNMSLSMCMEDIRRLEAEFNDKINNLGDNNSVFHFNRSLNREREKSNKLERKLKEYEGHSINVSRRLEQFETANNDADLQQVRATVDRIVKENREEFDNLENSIEGKLNTSEFYQFKKEVNNEMSKLQRSLNNIESVVQDFTSERQSIVRQQKQSASEIEVLNQQIRQLRSELEKLREEQNGRYSKIEESLRNVRRLVSTNKPQFTSTDKPNDDWNSALEKGIGLLKESGGVQTSHSLSHSQSEESFSERIQP